MKRPLGPTPALICASVLLLGHTCLGQTTPKAPAPGPVVVGEKPQQPAPEQRTSPQATSPQATSPQTAPQDKPVMDLTFHPDPKDVKPDAQPKEASPAPKDQATALPADPKEIAPATNPPVERDASAAFATPSSPYVIGALDVLEIKVWNAPNMSGFQDVGSDGMISMPLIGEIRADGMTKEQLTRIIRQKLAASVFTDPPEVTVTVPRVNSKKYYVYGGVNRPGEFPLMGPTTVLDAFATTGGFHDFANKKNIYILRGDKKIRFNYNEVSQGKHMEQNILLQNGDRIFVKD